MATVRMTKMHGTGNDYVYVDCREHDLADPPRVARAVSRRHHGIGADGLILIRPSSAAHCRMEMYNADGSRGADVRQRHPLRRQVRLRPRLCGSIRCASRPTAA